MQLPAFLPAHLAHYASAIDDNDLLNQLILHPSDLIIFFEYACQHQTWSEEHSSFMLSAIEWMTKEFLAERLSRQSAESAIKALQKNLPALHQYIPKNIYLCSANKRIAVNSMFAAVSSDVLHQLIRLQCREKGLDEIMLPEIPGELLEDLVEFINTGTIATIWRHSREDLFIFLRVAMRWGFYDVAILCQETLKRYISSGDVIETLLMAQENSWSVLAQHCCDYITLQGWGIKCSIVEHTEADVLLKESRLLRVEFFDFSDNALSIFERLKLHITHLVCSGYLTSDATFGRVLQSCPRLIALDISRTRALSDYLTAIPSQLEELDVSQCNWLRNGILKRIISICPNLRRLIISSNIGIGQGDLSGLQELKGLISLDVSRCYQMRDEHLNLIFKACPKLLELSLADCHQLTNKAFFDLAKTLPQIVVLNVSRCHISDGLLLEISMRCRRLRYLFVERCPEISERGIFQLVQQAPELRLLDIKHCHVSPGLLEQIRSVRPNLQVRI